MSQPVTLKESQINALSDFVSYCYQTSTALLLPIANNQPMLDHLHHQIAFQDRFNAALKSIQTQNQLRTLLERTYDDEVNPHFDRRMHRELMMAMTSTKGFGKAFRQSYLDRQGTNSKGRPRSVHSHNVGGHWYFTIKTQKTKVDSTKMTVMGGPGTTGLVNPCHAAARAGIDSMWSRSHKMTEQLLRAGRSLQSTSALADNAVDSNLYKAPELINFLECVYGHIPEPYSNNLQTRLVAGGLGSKDMTMVYAIIDETEERCTQDSKFPLEAMFSLTIDTPSPTCMRFKLVNHPTQSSGQKTWNIDKDSPYQKMDFGSYPEAKIGIIAEGLVIFTERAS